MSGAGSRATWIGGTAVVVILVLLGAWFLGVSPQMTKATAARTEQDSVDTQNGVLRTRIDKLKAQSAKLGDYKNELAALRVGIPTAADLPDFVLQIDAAAKASGVFVADIIPADPELVISEKAKVAAEPTAPVAKATAPAPTPTPTPTPTTAPATAADTAKTPTGIDGFVGIPVAIRVFGSYDKFEGFLRAMQSGKGRFYLVTKIDATGQEKTAPQSGIPALAVGDVDATLNGYLFVLRDATAVPSGTTGALPPLPAPPDGRNPFVPIQGAS
jgi:Tfp pilus assembly protein PilO